MRNRCENLLEIWKPYNLPTIMILFYTYSLDYAVTVDYIILLRKLTVLRVSILMKINDLI